MRILHLVHQYLPDHVGGTELYTQTLAQAQARRGDEVAVFTPGLRPKDGLPAATNEAGVAVWRVPVGVRGSVGVFRSTFGNAALLAGLGTVLDEHQPDIVHIQHLMGLPVNLVEMLVARRIPFVIALHDYWYGCANAQLLTNYDNTICAGPNAGARNCGRCAVARAGLPGGGLLAATVAPIMRRRNVLLREVMSAAALVMAPNTFVRDTYAALDLPVDSVIVLPWGMDLPADLPAIRAAAADERQTRPARPLRLGYIGSLSHQKGIHVLVQAVNQLPADDVTLDIYGNPTVFPDYVAELRQLSGHPGTHFAGLLPRSEFWARLARLDALVLPTLWYEASPLTIDEAFAAGTPVIGSNLGALPVMVRDGIDGRLFPPGDVTALVAVLQAASQDPERIAALRQAIRPVKTMDEHAAEIAGWYDRVVGGAAL